MKKPDIKDYNLTGELIEQLKKSDARNKKILLVIPIILVLTYSIYGAARSVSPDYRLLIYIVPFYSVLGIVGGGIVGGILIGFYTTIIPQLSRNRANLIKYEDAKQKYEEPIIRDQLNFWRGLDIKGLGHELAGLFEKSGYSVSPAGGENKLLLEKNSKKSIVQYYIRDKKLSLDEVREFYTFLKKSGADNAVLVSLSGFDRKSCKFARGRQLQLMEISDIILMKEDFS